MNTATETKAPFQQKAKVGVAGSFFNQLMGNNATIPVVGEGATELMYTDRICYDIVEVSADGKTVKLQMLEAKAARPNLPMGHQEWVFEKNDAFITITWRNGAWRKVCKSITLVDSFVEQRQRESGKMYNFLTDEDRKEIYAGSQSGFPSVLIEGKTRVKTTYDKISIIFGRRDYYYDWSF